MTAHGNDFHGKMLLVSEARIKETIMLVFNEIFNKTRIATRQNLAEINPGKSFFECNLTLKAFECIENTKLRWLNVIVE